MDLSIKDIFKLQSAFSKEVRGTSYKERIVKIKKIKNWIYSNRTKIQNALSEDFSKPKVETDITEVWVSMDMANHIIKNLKSWMAPKVVSSTLPVILSKSTIEYYPKGQSLIIAPWNYPFQLCIAPLLYSIAAGNCTIIKPSEITPKTSNLVCSMIEDLFDEKEVCVIQGAEKEAKELLELPFNHIFFTGSSQIGSKVVEASSKHLSSTTLELGGKSPVIVDKGYNLDRVINRLIAAKFVNMGQSCIAPDYVAVHADDYSIFVEKLISKLKSCYGETFKEQIKSKSLARIVNRAHYNRVLGLIDSNKDKILYGGERDDDELFISPTIISSQLDKEEPLLEEIFGPVIPIIKYSSGLEVKSIISNIGSPLALYIFSSNKTFIGNIKNETSSGAVCINDIAAHFLNNNLPFGGVMSSGSGRYHGFSGFKEFSNQRSILHQSRLNFLATLSPPYTKKIEGLVNLVIKLYNKL